MLIPKFHTVFHAVRRMVKAVLTGKRLFVNWETGQRRAHTCRTRCGYYDGHNDQCSRCACFVGVKAQFATERCPLGRWHRDWVNTRE